MYDQHSPIGFNNISGIAEPMADNKNKIAAKIKPFLRPSFLLIIPPEIPPIIHPIKALETTNPNRAFAAFLLIQKEIQKNFPKN